MWCQGQSGWFPWSVCLIPTSMSYIHPQKSTKYNICDPTISLTHFLYVMSKSVWLIPLVSLSDPHIYVIYIYPQKSTLWHIYICVPAISLTHHLFVMSRSVWLIPLVSLSDPHIYVIHTSTEVHQIQYMYLCYITDTSCLCHVKVSLADSPGQSVWSPQLWHTYIYRSPPNTIYVTLTYRWPIFSMWCQGQSGWFPWSICLIPTSMTYIHLQKSTKYNIYVPTIFLTHPLYVMSRSVWLIPFVSLPDPTSMSYIHPQKSI